MDLRSDSLNFNTFLLFICLLLTANTPSRHGTRRLLVRHILSPVPENMSTILLYHLCFSTNSQTLQFFCKRIKSGINRQKLIYFTQCTTSLTQKRTANTLLC